MALTIAEHSKLAGRTTGFDYMRIVLSMSIILWHGISISYGLTVERVWWHNIVGLTMNFVLPMFFALSGFLVAGSLDRCRTLISFFGLRMLRIVPALAVEVTLSAMLFGPAITSLALGAYFTDPRFAHYFLNMIGDIHYVLPGLFEHNPLPETVNTQLWTIPFELQCYLAIGGLATARLLHWRWIMLLVVLASQALWVWQSVTNYDTAAPGRASGPILVISFLTGILFHLYRDRILLRLWYFIIAVVGGYILSSLAHGGYYLPLPATYITVYLGLQRPRLNRLIASGDYSYRLYLYGYPLQQAVASFGAWAQHWWINVGIALPGALLIAWFSWHVVEKPVLGLRRLLPGLEDRAQRLAGASTKPLISRFALPQLFALAALLGGLAGNLLLVNGTERLAVVAVVGSFAAAFLVARSGRPDWFPAGLAPRSGA